MIARFDTWSDPSPHASHFVTVNGVRLQYLDWGGSGEALVLIHGLGDTPHYFDDLAPALRDRWRVVAYARRGHGRSEARSPYDADTLAEDLRQLPAEHFRRATPKTEEKSRVRAPALARAAPTPKT